MAATLVAQPGAAPDPDVREELRRQTASLHSRVDTLMPLAKPDPSLADYREHLEILLQWTARLPRLPLLEGRLSAQSTALEADLRACEEIMGRGRLRPGSRSADPHQPVAAGSAIASHGRAFAWGIAYVVEGSHLGGWMLFRRLADRLAPHPLGYLRGAGRDTGARWSAFVSELRDEVRTGEEIEQACRGAALAFELLIAGLGATGEQA